MPCGVVNRLAEGRSPGMVQLPKGRFGREQHVHSRIKDDVARQDRAARLRLPPPALSPTGSSAPPPQPASMRAITTPPDARAISLWLMSPPPTETGWMRCLEEI